jgi:hypothetical protein
MSNCSIVWMTVFPGLFFRYRGVTDIGQCVVLGEDADDRTALAPTGYEGRGHVGDAALHAKPFFFQHVRQQLGGPDLFKCNFREIPQLHGQVLDDRLQVIDLLDGHLFLEAWLGVDGIRLQCQEGQTAREAQVFHCHCHGFTPYAGGGVRHGLVVRLHRHSRFAPRVVAADRAVCPAIPART